MSIPWLNYQESPRDWKEDSAHENGNYFCKCIGCGNTFMGHKRRVECKLCAGVRSEDA